MEIEKTLSVAAPREQVWALLLDPQVMGGAVPGMKSIEVISPTEYVAVMHQKISFISAKFKLRTHIVEQRPPEYLRAEGTGEDASVASSLKQQSEVFLSSTADGGTELRIKVTVEVLGRLGTFGLSVMKTKADRMWDEFGANLKARLEADSKGTNAPAATLSAEDARASAVQKGSEAVPVNTRAIADDVLPRASGAPAPRQSLGGAQPAVPIPADPIPNGPGAAPNGQGYAASVSYPAEVEEGGFWARVFGNNRSTRTNGHAMLSGRNIRVEVRQMDRTVTVDWPVEAADKCRDWLTDLVARNH